MLALKSGSKDAVAAQAALEDRFRGALKNQGKWTVGFPGGNDIVTLYSNGPGDIWCSFKKFENLAIPRFWNAFGIFRPEKRVQMISAELNVPTKADTEVVAGFFARDPLSARTYLLHSGKVGGGGKGIGKESFLAWSGYKRIPVIDSRGHVRHGIVVGAVEANDLVERVASFVHRVADFKRAVKNGELASEDFGIALEKYREYSDEFSGLKAGYTKTVEDYISYHGDVVSSLREFLRKRFDDAAKIYNTQLIDLLVEQYGEIKSLYEIKTSPTRQSVYAAIGQLLVHSSNRQDIEKVLILPISEALPADIEKSIKGLGISLWRFGMDGNGQKGIRFLVEG
jgi:hypothetical protein